MAGESKEVQSSKAGTYILVNGQVNGYHYWLKTDGNYAIWFDKVSSNWIVSVKEDLGSNTGGIAGPKGKDSYPNEIKQGWDYFNHGAWHNAGPNDVIFKVTGTFFKSYETLSAFTKIDFF